MLEMKTETETITKHKFGVWLTMEEIDRCVVVLAEHPHVTEGDRILAEELSSILHKAKKQTKEVDNFESKTLTEDRIIKAQSGACTTGNCD
tara:strand:+ start:10392 stop:10664 length:273 start_codon:yes stop_codon:yes gene_type:complete